MVKARMATLWEMKNCYTLTDMLKLYALYEMENDIESARAYEMERRNEK